MGGNGCDLLCSYDLTSGTNSHLPKYITDIPHQIQE